MRIAALFSVRMAISPLALTTALLAFQSHGGSSGAGREAASPPDGRAASGPSSQAASGPSGQAASRPGRPTSARPRAQAPTKNPNFKPCEFTGKDGAKLNYWLMTPKDYDPSQKYPLLLALHGSQGIVEAPNALGSDEMREKHRWFVMAPAAPDGSTWAMSKEMKEEFGEMRSSALPLVLEALEALEKESAIDPRRLYVTGQSMGGAGTYGALALRPEMFAAAAPICGRWDLADAAKFAHVPMWIFHGDADTRVPVHYSRDMAEALKKAGGAPRYTEFPGVGHNSWLNACAMPELWDWMEAQRLKKPAEGPRK